MKQLGNIEMGIGARNWFICLVAALFVTDLAIFADIPVLRQVLGFLYFTTVPGLLILYILKLNKISLLKKFLLSVGLSITLLLFAGLLINALFPLVGYPTPLSAPSLLVSFNIIMILLYFTAYWRNRKDFDFSHPFTYKPDNQNKLISPLLFSLLFPLLSVLGTHLMNTSGSNIVLLVMFSLIPVYIVWLMWQNKKVPEVTYPVAIVMMSTALLLSRGLTSNYLMGGDIYTEYYSTQITSYNLQWTMSNFPAMVGGSLSVSLLPTIFRSLLGIDVIYVYKVLFLVLIAIVPVVTYAFTKKYMTPLYAFLTSCFLMAQIPFIYLLTGQMRVGIALFFFSLAIMVLFDDDIGVLRKSVLFVILGMSTLVSYYVTPVLLAVLISILWIVPRIPRILPKSQSVIRGSSIAVLLMFIALWWGVAVQTLAPGETFDFPTGTITNMATPTPVSTPGPDETPVPTETPHPEKEKNPAATGFLSFIRDILDDLNPSSLSNPELRGPEVQVLLELSDISLPRQVTTIVNYLAFLIIGIGVVALWLIKSFRKNIDPNYVVIVSASLVLAALPIILPRMSVTYAGDRLFLQLLFILAPAFIIGCMLISRCIPQRRNLPLIGLVLVSLFLCNSYLLHQLLGSPQGDILDTGTSSRAHVYVYDSEVQAAQWLGDHNVDNIPVRIGNITQLGGGVFDFTSHVLDRQFAVWSFGRDASVPGADSWILLRHINVVDGLGYELDENHFSVPFSISKYAPQLSDRDKVYTAGDAEIYTIQNNGIFS